MNLTDKVIVITGASDGIGAEMARQLSPGKPKLVLAARSQDRLEELAIECIALGAQALVVRTDVGRQEDCLALIKATVAQYGRIDVLVNNAGLSMHANFNEISDLSTFERLFRVNTLGAVWCTHAAMPYLNQSKGMMVAVSSLAGKTGVPGRTTYCASKFALSGFVEALRIETAESGVHIMGAFPGVVLTETRRRGLNGAGQTAGVSRLKEEGAMTVETCAALIIDGMRKRKREVVMTFKGKFGLFLKVLIPKVVDKLAKATVKPHSNTP
jgi:short-subunit dehydrogenase